MRILAVVVTYNRRELLARCVDALKGQTRPPDGIVVINNGSTDGTETMLADRGVRCITQENLGSAGGWYRGVELSLSEGFDAVWLMDDDGFPAPEALARLVPQLLPGRACVSSVVLQETDHRRFVFPFPVLNEHGVPALVAWPRKVDELEELSRLATKGTYPFAHFFNGALIKTQAIRQIGNVEQGFFMFGDEVDYFFRLRAVGEVVSVLEAHHYHPDVSARPYSPAKIYYYVKNTLVLNDRYFDWKWFRHGLAVGAVIARTARRNGPREALSYAAGRNLPVLLRAVSRGLKGQVGKDFDV